jgi:YHS domain-containing protein
LLYLLASVLVISMLRAIMGALGKLFSEMFQPSSTPASGAGPRTPPAPASESLKKDPVCGTFIAPSTSVQKTVGGQTYYFCSADCRDKFKA